MQEIGPHREFCAHCGEVLPTVFQRLGAVGLVSDAAVRYLKEVRALRFHYLATSTVASHGNFRVARAQVPVTICGLHLRPGTLVHGDANGLILVPKEGLDRPCALAGKVRRSERQLLDYVRSRTMTLAGLRKKILY